jgi:hypothetical protein
MRKIVTALIATSALGLMLAGAGTAASAHNYRHHCGSCGGPVAPTTIYKTVHPQLYSTKYHDVSKTHVVHRVHRITTIVRVQPVLHIHEVTRVHHHTVVATSNAYYHETEHLSPIRQVSHSVENIYGCGCRP